MQSFVTEQQRLTPVAANVDVVVVGGGFAGVAAATAAARSGASVILLEKQCVLGGLGTAGLIVIYLPLCDGLGRQLIGGLGEELLKLCVDAGKLQMPEGEENPRATIPECWQAPATREERAKARYMVMYEAVPAMLAFERLLLSESVDIWYDTHFCGCAVSDDNITHVFVENKSGRLAIGAKAFIDCSGDADLCHAAGEETVSSAGNVRAGWYYGADISQNKLILHRNTDPRNGELRPGGRFYRGDDGWNVSRHVIDMHRYIEEKSDEFNKRTGINEIPFMMPTMPLFRMTRRLKSRGDITKKDIGRWHESAVGMSGDWRKAERGYCIPLESLHGQRISNLLAAGRCCGTAGDAWDALRVIPTCAVTGEAAGIAAALLAQGKAESVQGLDTALVAGIVKEQGGIIDAALLESI